MSPSGRFGELVTLEGKPLVGAPDRFIDAGVLVRASPSALSKAVVFLVHLRAVDQRRHRMYARGEDPDFEPHGRKLGPPRSVCHRAFEVWADPLQDRESTIVNFRYAHIELLKGPSGASRHLPTSGEEKIRLD